MNKMLGLEVIFNPLLAFSPVVAVTVFAIVILIMINICYKFLVNQSEAKQIKDRIKEVNNTLRQEQKAGNTARVSELMSEVMKENSKMMKMTMKPMLASLIVVILFLPWLSGNYGDQTVNMADNKGNITINNNLYNVQRVGDTVTVGSVECTMPCRTNIGNATWNIQENGDNIQFARIVALLPIAIPVLFGDDLGWLGWYLIVSIPLMLLIRKSLKINI